MPSGFSVFTATRATATINPLGSSDFIFNAGLKPAGSLSSERTILRRSSSCLLLPAALLFCGCSVTQHSGSGHPRAAIESVYSSLSPAGCSQHADPADPNATPYWTCPGTAAYHLIVRRVDAGRRSIDVVDPSGQASPLNYQEFVTRHMCTLGGQAEWRVTRDRDGKQIPIALIVPVLAHEDKENPEKATRTYLAVAKISPRETCVTTIIPDGAQPQAGVLRAADNALATACAPPLPPLTVGGVVIR